MRDSYVDWIVDDGQAGVGTLLFSLNTFEIDRETFKLASELLMSKITAARLDPDYLKELVIGPMQAAIALADGDREAAGEELAQAKRNFEVGTATIVDSLEAQAHYDEKQALLKRAEIDLLQRQIEIDGQSRRLAAEQKDLNERIVLNQRIRELNQFRMPASGSVEVYTYSGSFVEKGEPICTINLDTPLISLKGLDLSIA